MTVILPSVTKARRLFTGIAVCALAMAIIPGVAYAHTDFVSSNPSDQAVVDGPLHEVSVNFTNPAQASGSGFELLDPDGVVRAPTTIDPTDGTTFILGFDPPLTAGTYGIRWKVQAGDAHPIDGAFQFEVTGEPTTTTPATTLPAVAATATTIAPAAGIPADDSSSSSLDEFLASSSTADDGSSLGRFGRIFTFAGTIFGIGTLAALTWVVRGRRDELRSLVSWVRLAGLAIAVGGLIELAALQIAQSSEIRDLFDTKPGFAALLKVVGGLAIWFGFHDKAGQIVPPARTLSAAAATVPHQPTQTVTADEHRWTPTASAGIGLAGFALVLASFWFDGHTVSKGPWAFHSLVNLIHIGSAAVWGGGVLAMTAVAWLRKRRSDRTGLAAMVIRFSTLASISLVAVTLAGLVMTFMILDSPGDLFSTEWGQVMLIKTAAVSIAIGVGAYNHFRLRPALERSPADPKLGRELRISLTVESAIFATVVALTAWLVAAAT